MSVRSTLDCGSLLPHFGGSPAAAVQGGFASVLLACLFLLLPLIGSAQEIVVNAGSSQVINAPVSGASYVWELNGDVSSQTGSSYTFAPQRRDVGTHLLKLEVTLGSGAVSTYQWRLRGRIALPTSTVNYYVATNGSDADPGTITEPFATLEKARDVIRTFVKPLPAGGVTVWVRGGTYRRTATFDLTASDSGTAAAPIFYKAYPGETPVFTTGAPLLASAFVPLDAALHSRVAAGVTPTNIKQLELTAFNFANDGPIPVRYNQNRLRNPYDTSRDGELFEVFFNGARSPMSRYPNDNLADRFATPNLQMDGVTQKWPTTLNGEAIGCQFKFKTTDETRILRWQTAVAEGSLFVQGFWRVPWEEYGFKVKSIDSVANTITTVDGASSPSGIGNKYYDYAGSLTEPYWAVNLLEEIDQAGEWSIDSLRGKLYFLPPATITDGAVEISDFTLPVMKLTNVTHTVLQGLSFNISLATGVVVSGGSNNLVLGCKFSRMGSYAVDLDQGTSNGVVSCDMSDMAAGGVYVRGGDATVTPRVSCDHFVVNNDMNDIAKVVKIYAAGVDAGFGGQAGAGGGGGNVTCVGARVAHNRIAYTHHVGILHGSLDKALEYNVIDNFCRTNNDMGGIYCFNSTGGNDVIRYNQMTNKAYSWLPYFPNTYGGSGIQVDNTATGSRMFGNVIETRRTAIQFSTVTGALLYNNAIINNAKAAVSYSGTPVEYRTNFAALGQTNMPAGTTGINKTYSSDPGIISRTTNDYRLKRTSVVYTDLPLFDEIPVELMGLYVDEVRTTAPTLVPIIDSPSGAAIVTQFAATVSAQLDFPLVNDDTTVRVYYGTADGGTTAASWQSNVSLGIKTRGSWQQSLTGLAQQTKYYYRFNASNAAGTAWTSATRNFTTAGPPSTKANNTSDLSLAASWVNNAVPAGGMGIWDSTVTAANTTTIGTGLSLLGIHVTNPGGDVTINAGTSGALTLGSGGLDLSGSTRLLNIAAPLVLAGDQTWITGSSGAAKSTQITVSGVISGSSELRIAGTAGRGVALTGDNTFTGGLVLDSTGRVVTGISTATATSSSLGVGPLTILGGTIATTGAFGLNQGIANSIITVSNDFALEPAGRIMFAGLWDLGGSTRTVSCSRTATSNNALIAGGNTSWGLATIGTVLPVVSNGTLRVTRASGATNYVSFRMNNSPAFNNNAGLSIGAGVISVLAADWTNADATKLAELTVESGGYFGLCENTTARNATICSLSGSGEVGNYNLSTTAATVTLTINGGTREDAAIFSGSIVDSNAAINTTAGSNLGKVNVVKTGNTTQTLAGTNTYSGTTTVNGGVLNVTGSIASTAALSVGSTARLGGSGTIASPTSIAGAVEPVSTLTINNTLGFAATSRFTWNLLSSATTAGSKIAAGATTITSGAVMDLNFHEFIGSSVRFTDAFWSVPQSFTVMTGSSITGNFTLGEISADSTGLAASQRGAFSLVNTGMTLTLQWYPFTPVEAWRFQHFGIYTNTGDAADNADPDLDGYNNAAEYTAGTDPNDVLDYPGYVWTNTTGPSTQTWSTAANWSSNAQPPSAATTRLEFLTGITTTTAAMTAQNNLGSFMLNRLVLGGNSTGTTLMTHTGNGLNFVAQTSVLPSIDFTATGTAFTHDLAMPIVLTATTSIHRTGTGIFFISGAISGTGGLNVDAGTGTVLLTGTNSYSGITTIETGTLKVGNDGAVGTFGTGAVVNNGTLRIERTGTILVPNDISGTGNVIVSNPGTNDVAVLSGNNSFTGSVGITGGARITTSNGLGSGVKTISLSGGTTSNLRFDGSAGAITLPVGFTINSSNPNGSLVNEAGNNVILGPVMLTSGAGGSRFISQAGTLTIAGAVKPTTTGRTLDLRGAGKGIISGGLTDGTGANTLTALTKGDAGTWTLSGINSYTGGTTVSAGTLEVTGSLACASSLTVVNGASYVGNGSFGTASTITGTLAPQQVSFPAGASFAASSVLSFQQVNNSASTGARVDGSTISVTSGARVDVVLNASGSSTNLLHSFWRSARSWTLVNASSMTGSFALGNVSADAGGRSAAVYGSFSLQQNSTGVTLLWTPIAGFPVINDPVLARVLPVASPVATVDVQHRLRVAVTATGGGVMSYAWTMTSGPGIAIFANANSADTSVSFDVAGRYTLRCTATNEVGTGYAEFIVDAAAPASFSLRQGVDGFQQRATFIRADNTAWNSGARDQMLVGKTSASMRSIFAFDLDTIPRTWPVTAVTLDIWTDTQAGSGTIGAIELRRLTRNFVEGTGDGITSTNGAGTGATWATYNGSTAWTTAGSDFDATALSTVAGYLATVVSTQKTFPTSPLFLSTLNDAMTANSSLNLMLISPTTEAGTSNNYTRLASDDKATESLRPKLTVSFTHAYTPTITLGAAPSATVGSNVSLSGSVTNATSSAWSLVSGPGQIWLINTSTVKFSAPGTYTLQLAASNSNGESNRTLDVIVTGTAMTPIEIWRQNNFGNHTNSGIGLDTGDSDGDGAPNLLEYATAMDVAVNDRVPTSASKVGATIEFVYTKNKAATDVTYLVEWSDDLATWSTAGVTSSVLTDGATTQQIKALVPAGVTRRFVHLKVTRQ